MKLSLKGAKQRQKEEEISGNHSVSLVPAFKKRKKVHSDHACGQKTGTQHLYEKIKGATQRGHREVNSSQPARNISVSSSLNLCSTLNMDMDTYRAFCPYPMFTLSVFLYFSTNLTDTDQTEQYHWKPGGAVLSLE